MQNRKILPFNWRDEAEIELKNSYSIDNEVILLDQPVIISTFEYPFKLDVNVIIICIKGKTEGFINLKRYTTDGACFIVLLPGQIMQYKSISEDFSGLFIIMSQKFADSLMPNVADRLPLSLSVRDNPVIPLNKDSLEGMIHYFELLKRVIEVKDHPYRMESVRHLTLAFFYGAGVYLHQVADNKKKTHRETIVEKFLQLVQNHHKTQRGLAYYADKLCITSAYLSKVVRETGGKPANEWIDEHVVLEAKALLKSTNMSIDQISEVLNFPSQSFFGKYFKRVTGMSPREYKRKV
jgi:AraC-like DNA-binding protein